MKRPSARKTQPLYLKIAGSLEAKIASGAFSVGSKLPTEHQLMDKFSISRATAISALDHLESNGYVYRRPRLGTEVVSRYPIKQQVTEGDVFHDWARMGTEYRLEILERSIMKIPAQFSQRRDQMGGKWLHLTGVRRAAKSENPICVAEIYVHPEFATISDEVGRFPSRVFTMIEEKFGVAVRLVQQEMRAVAIDAERSKLLGTPEGAPALQIVRWYHGTASRLIEVTVDTHPGHKFTYKSEVHRGQFD